MRAAWFGAVLGALWAAHDVADHVVQTDHQAATKSGDWRGMAGHISTYHLVQLAALAAMRPLGVRPSWRRAAAAVAVSAVTHAVLDRRWPVLAILRATGSRAFARSASIDVTTLGQTEGYVDLPRGHRPLPLHVPYLADQALHHGCLAVCAAIIAGGARCST